MTYRQFKHCHITLPLLRLEQNSIKNHNYQDLKQEKNFRLYLATCYSMEIKLCPRRSKSFPELRVTYSIQIRALSDFSKIEENPFKKRMFQTHKKQPAKKNGTSFIILIVFYLEYSHKNVTFL